MSGGERQEKIDGKTAPNWKDSAELEAYKALVSLHNAQETIFWTRNNILAVIQTALATGVFSVFKIGREEELLFWNDKRELSATALCVAGLIIAIAWVGVVRRTDFLFKTTLHILAEMEEFGFKVEPQFRAFGLFVSATRPRERQPSSAKAPAAPSGPLERWRLAQIWLALGCFFVAFWVFALCAIWHRYVLCLVLGVFCCFCLIAFADVSRGG